MKNYQKFSIGDWVEIVFSHSGNIGAKGVITLVRPSYCKIKIDGKEENHTYGQFKKIDAPTEN